MITTPSRRRGRPHATRHLANSAASQFGLVGLPDPGHGPQYGDGGLEAFARTFNRRFDEKAATDRPEWRSTARAWRETRAI